LNRAWIMKRFIGFGEGFIYVGFLIRHEYVV